MGVAVRDYSRKDSGSAPQLLGAFGRRSAVHSGLGPFDPATTMPLLVDRLTGSSVLVGLVGTFEV